MAAADTPHDPETEPTEEPQDPQVAPAPGAASEPAEATAPVASPRTTSSLSPKPSRRPSVGQVFRTVLVVVTSLLVLAGVAAAASGVWLIKELGTGGTARFTTTDSLGSTVLVAGPDVLGRNSTPVTVRVEAADADTELLASIAPTPDADAAVGDAEHTTLTRVDVDGWQVLTDETGTEEVEGGLTAGDVWTSTETGTGAVEVTVARSSGAQTLVVTDPDGNPVDLERVTLTWANGAWFVQAVALVLVGLVVAAVAAVALLRRARRRWGRGKPGTDGSAAGTPAAGADVAEEDGDEQEPVDRPGPRRQGNDEETVVLKLDRSASSTPPATASTGPDAPDGPDAPADRTETPNPTQAS